jgi:hypothetical protein
MKIGLILMFGSCETYYSVSITNESSKTVHFSYDGPTHELPPAGTNVFSVLPYASTPMSFWELHRVSEALAWNKTETVTGFYLLTPIPLRMANTLPVNISVTAGDFIDGGRNKTAVEIEENKE